MNDNYRYILGGAFGFGVAFAVIFMIHNHEWGASAFDFSYLQILGIVASTILGSGITYSKHTNEPEMSRTFLKIEIVLLASSMLIGGAKFIYFGKSITILVKYYYYLPVPGLLVGLLYIACAVWMTWQFVFKKQ